MELKLWLIVVKINYYSGHKSFYPISEAILLGQSSRGTLTLKVVEFGAHYLYLKCSYLVVLLYKICILTIYLWVQKFYKVSKKTSLL